MLQLDKIVHLRSALESKSSLIKSTEWDDCFNWYEEGSKRLQDAKIDSLKDLLQKANKKLKTQRPI